MPLYDSNKVTSKDETIVRIAGSSDELCDVELSNGIYRLKTDATVQIEQLFGKDPFPDSYFEIINTGTVVGSGGVRVQIAATANDPTTPDRDAPALKVALQFGEHLAFTFNSIPLGEDFLSETFRKISLNLFYFFVNR